MSAVMTLEALQRAVEAQAVEPPARPYVVVPRSLIAAAAEYFGSSVVIVEAHPLATRS